MHSKAVKVLVSSGVNFDEQNGRGNTPLHSAAIKGFSAAIAALLAAGADRTIANEKGMTPLDIATAGGHVVAARALDPNAADKGATEAKDHGKDVVTEHSSGSSSSSSGGGGGSGGWSNEELSLASSSSSGGGSSSRCGVDRVPAHEMNASRFASEYLSLHKPVIITGLLADWPAGETAHRSTFLNLNLLVSSGHSDARQAKHPTSVLSRRRHSAGVDADMRSMLTAPLHFRQPENGPRNGSRSATGV